MGKNGTKIVKLFLRFFFLFLLLQMLPADLTGQSGKAEREQKKYDRLIEKEKKAYEKRRKETIRHRYEIQSPETKARMKEMEKRSQMYGRKRKEPFFKKWVKRDKKPKRKKTRRKR